ncbi:MAG: BrnT family toxin [Eubacterium sp.]|nr:BrnT family toxin [Eubacterium sp.]
MSNRQYEWDENKNQSNLVKHGITLEAATAIFKDPLLYEFHDVKHSGYNKYGEWEDRYIAIGWLNRILYVVYAVCKQGDTEIYRMISARKANSSEKKLYEDWCKNC